METLKETFDSIDGSCRHIDDQDDEYLDIPEEEWNKLASAVVRQQTEILEIAADAAKAMHTDNTPEGFERYLQGVCIRLRRLALGNR